MPIQIAIDGPAGAGKTTQAKALAKRFHITYVNTGALYRAFAVHANRLKACAERQLPIAGLLHDFHTISAQGGS